MTDLSALAQIMTAAVAPMGALVAGLSVYFTYKGRHNQFRQVVYGRQMDAYFDISEAMSNLYAAAQSILAGGNPWVKAEDARARFRSALLEEHERFTGTVNRALIVLPSKVMTAVDDFNDTVLAIGAPAEEGLARPEPGSDLDTGLPPAAGERLARAYERAINCIRHHLAIDSLTTGMLKEMGIGSESVLLRSPRPGVNPLVPVGRSAP
jgi:hypothetical protein